jgi:hypothetical protein
MPHVVIEEALDLGPARQGIQLAARQRHEAAAGSRFGKTNLQEYPT